MPGGKSSRRRAKRLVEYANCAIAADLDDGCICLKHSVKVGLESNADINNHSLAYLRRVYSYRIVESASSRTKEQANELMHERTVANLCGYNSA